MSRPDAAFQLAPHRHRMIVAEEILESPLVQLVRCGVLHARVHDLLWGWNCRTIGSFIALVQERDYRLPHLHSASAQAELRAARDCALHAIGRASRGA